MGRREKASRLRAIPQPHPMTPSNPANLHPPSPFPPAAVAPPADICALSPSGPDETGETDETDAAAVTAVEPATVEGAETAEIATPADAAGADSEDRGSMCDAGDRPPAERRRETPADAARSFASRSAEEVERPGSDEEAMRKRGGNDEGAMRKR